MSAEEKSECFDNSLERSKLMKKMTHEERSIIRLSRPNHFEPTPKYLAERARRINLKYRQKSSPTQDAEVTATKEQ